MKTITIPLTEAQHEAVESFCRSTGMKIADFARNELLWGTRAQDPELIAARHAFISQEREQGVHPAMLQAV